MSITSDIRGYADNAIEQAIEQGRQVLGQAQSQFNDVTGQANEFVGKLSGSARENVTQLSTRAGGLRTQAEKAINLDAVKSAVEPYLAHARDYRHSVTDRAEALISTAKKDPRVAKAFETAESVTGLVVETVQDRIVRPAQSLTRRGEAAPRKSPRKSTSANSTGANSSGANSSGANSSGAKSSSHASATKPATTRSASTAPARKTTARKTTARKTTAKKSSGSSKA